MKSLKLTITSSLVLAAICASTATAQEELVFHDRFNNTTGENIDFAAIDWSAVVLDPMHGDPEKPVDASTLDATPTALLAGITGNAGYEVSFDDNDLGFIFLWQGAKTTEYALMYDSFSLDRSQMEITRVTWQDNSGNDGELIENMVHFMVKIGGQWYVTDQGYTKDEPGREAWELKEHPFTTAGSDWRTLTADVTLPWELGATLTGDLPDGNIEAIGIYALHQPIMGSMRIDELQIYAEPVEGGDMWMGYPVDAQGWVDTSPWIGWVNVVSDPWVWSTVMDAHIFVGDDSGWIYVPNN